ncbi:MAG: AmmeMemoRadiSam system protein B [bacterium]
MKSYSSGEYEQIRKPAVAGMFYPDSPSNLRSTIKGFLSKVDKLPIDKNPVALIVPHAGYMYSGQVAAHAYKQIEGLNFNTVVLIGVSHRAPVRGASVYKSGAYETPLGIVEVDADLAEKIMAQSEVFGFYPSADAIEHSLEVQVPFLQVVLSNFKIVPILMGHYSEYIISAITDTLVNVIKGNEGILLVASTDMSHYHPYRVAVNMDDIAISSIKRMDTDQLMQDLDSGECELCGAGPVIVVLMTAKKLGVNNIEVLKYANSGDVTGDKSGGVVGYFSAVIY